MNRFPLSRPAFGGTVLVVSIALVGCGRNADPTAKPAPPPAAVTVETVSPAPLRQFLVVTGTVEPTVIAGLASLAEGPVIGCRIREGDRVHEGQELLRIGRKLSADAAQAAAREELRRQEQEFRRVESLVADRAVADNLLDSARSALERARAALAQAEQSADDFSILAPWDGVVSRVRVADGNYVAPRMPLIDLYDPASLVLRFSVPEDHAFRLDTGGRVIAAFDAVPNREFTLEIVRAYPELDRRLRTRAFEAALPDDVTFAPGMFARIRALLQEVPDAISVPVDAVEDATGGRFVFLAVEGQAVRRLVETGFEQDGRVLVRSGLSLGDRLIVGGIERVKDGAAVRTEDGPSGPHKAAP